MKEEPTLLQKLDTLRQISERSKSWWVYKTADQAIEEINRLTDALNQADPNPLLDKNYLQEK